MNLLPRLQLAGAGLLAMPEPAHEGFIAGGWEAAHDMGRWWDAALRLEATIGFAIPRETETTARRNLARLTDNPDRLLCNRPDIACLQPKAKLNPHNFRETLLAYNALIRWRQDPDARAAALTLVAAMDRALQPDGRLDCTRFGLSQLVPFTQDPSHAPGPAHAWFDSTGTSGRALEALVWLYEATGEPTVLALATRIAEHHLQATVNPDGTVRNEITAPHNVGHNHSYLGTLRGLLLFGLLTGRREFVTTVAATYRRGVRGIIVKESGWTPHDLGKTRFPNPHGDPVADPASAGDSAQIALWLALRTGADDLLDDVERLVRARLLPTQLTDEEIARNPAQGFKARDRGAWRIHGECHAEKGCTPDVHAAVIHTLCDIRQNVCSATPGGVRVNLHFDTDNDWLRLTCHRDTSARVRVELKRTTPLAIRLPGWASATGAQLTLNNRPQPLQQAGVFVQAGTKALPAGSVVELTFDLPGRTSEEQMPSGRTYRFTWRGDEITGIAPQDQPVPFYPAAG
ncbi:MAG: hypothetical protein H3C27_05540 [Opitutaceae bacterium]|nr:hypothetical protein [Opitutaceae bacterium]